MSSFEGWIRVACFAGVLTAMVAWEFAGPRRPRTAPRLKRWATNLGILIVSTGLLRWTFPLIAVGMAALAAERGWGLFNNYPVPTVIAVVAGIVALDFVIFLQHVLFHRLPLFWRLHKVHHADRDLDATSGGRFHPVEIWLSMGIKVAAVAVIGPPVLAVLLFEILLNATSLFNHSNINIPVGVDRILRLFVVTPDMHRVHHSVIPRETNSNFGFNLPWWDRFCGTYRAQPQEGHLDMTIGLTEYPDANQQHLFWALLLPFMPRSRVEDKKE